MYILINISYTEAYIYTYTTHTTYIQSKESKQNNMLGAEEFITGVMMFQQLGHGRDQGGMSVVLVCARAWQEKERGERPSRA